MIWPRENYFVAVFRGITEAVLNDLHPPLAAQARLLALPAGPEGASASILPVGKEPDLLESLRTFASGISEDVRERARTAFEEVLRSGNDATPRVSIAGAMRRVANHFVLPIVRVDRVALEATPRLTREVLDGNVRAPRGFADAVIECLLADASNELAREHPGEMTTWAERDYQALLRRAASLFLDRIALGAGSPSAMGGLMDRINSISVLPYEGDRARGGLVLAPRDHPSLRRTIAFQDGVSLRDAKATRKLLQMVADGGLLWCSGEVLIGLAEEGSGYDRSREDRFGVRFLGTARWQLDHAGSPLLDVEHGAPRLPRPRMDQTAFATSLQAHFRDANVEALWRVVEAAQEQHHGTMVVVSGEATTEARRLAPQLVRIDPKPLDAADVLRLSAIDGALLLDPDGRCHALGVILDGTASPGRGTFSRGARHNSAIKYTDSHGLAVAIVVSEDGDVTITAGAGTGDSVEPNS